MGKLIQNNLGFEFDEYGQLLVSPSSAKAAAKMLHDTGKFMAKITDGHNYAVYISIVEFSNCDSEWLTRNFGGVSILDAGGRFLISVDQIGCVYLSLQNTKVSEGTLEKYFPALLPRFGTEFGNMFCNFLNMLGSEIRNSEQKVMERVSTKAFMLGKKGEGAIPLPVSEETDDEGNKVVTIGFPQKK